jgi:hypothetical protein
MSKQASKPIIAIPSHRRPDILRTNTLALIKRSKGKFQIDVFLSDAKDAAIYAGDNWPVPVNLIVPDKAIKSLTEKLNVIHEHYPVGAQVTVMEDDMQALMEKDEAKMVQRDDALPHIIAEGFEGAAKSQTKLWGVCASANGFYMDDRNSASLKLVVGFLFGFVSTRDSSLRLKFPAKTDYERTLRYYTKFAAVFRINRYALKTKSYTQPGGINAQMSDRGAQEEASVAGLVEEFPKMIARNLKRAATSPYPELKFLRQ